jgi:hypothetical protein
MWSPEPVSSAVFSRYLGRNVDEVVTELEALGNFPIIRKVEQHSTITTEVRLDRVRVFYDWTSKEVVKVVNG